MANYEEGSKEEAQRRSRNEGVANTTPTEEYEYRGIRHPDHRHLMRRSDDRVKSDFFERFQAEPLTMRKMAVLLSFVIFINQTINWFQRNTVTPDALKETNASVAELKKIVNDLKGALEQKQQGDNFFYYSICYSWRQKFPTQYPAFCDKPEIQQFDPLGRVIPVPSPK